MARNSRHNKILEIITNNEIETQEELVTALRNAKYDVTQATISRDIKELGLIKIISDNKKYKYATPSSTKSLTDKTLSMFRDCVISNTVVNNLLVVKVLNGMAGFVSSIIREYAITQVLGITYGDDTVLIITKDQSDAELVSERIASLIA